MLTLQPQKWADDRDPLTPGPPSTNVATNVTGSDPNDYTTSIIGNASLAWVKSVVDSGPVTLFHSISLVSSSLYFARALWQIVLPPVVGLTSSLRSTIVPSVA